MAGRLTENQANATLASPDPDDPAKGGGLAQLDSLLAVSAISLPWNHSFIEFVHARLTLARSAGNCRRAVRAAASDFVNRGLTLVAPTT